MRSLGGVRIWVVPQDRLLVAGPPDAASPTVVRGRVTFNHSTEGRAAYGFAGSKLQICLPVAASRATTRSVDVVMYITPSMTMGLHSI